MGFMSKWTEIVLKTVLGITIFSLLALYGIDPPSLSPTPSILSPGKILGHPPTVRELEWTITKSQLRPDGVLKTIYHVNNAFPGPLIEAQPGDTLRIHVINGLADEGTAIHWHGLLMQDQNDMDGAVGFTQDPIKPGAEMTYEITLDEEQCGTFWWHAHESMQRSEGLYGCLVIHCPSQQSGRVHAGVEDEVKSSRSGQKIQGELQQEELEQIRKRKDLVDVGEDGLLDEQHEIKAEHVLLIGDWYHLPAAKTLEWYTRPAAAVNEPVPDSLLVNGVGAFNCSKAVPARPLDCDQREPPTVLQLDTQRTTRLRLVNVGSLAGVTVSIPGAKLRVTHIDGGNAVEQRTAHEIGILYPGERVDVILEWEDCFTEDPQLTVILDDENFRHRNPALTATQSFPISVSHPPSQCPTSSQQTPSKFNIQTAISKTPVSLTKEPSHPLLIYANTMQLVHLGNTPLGFFNQTTWTPQSPPLRSIPGSSWDDAQLIPAVVKDTWIDIVINNLDDGGHPFHLHGHEFYVLKTYAAAVGWGSWNPFAEGAMGKENWGAKGTWEWERPRKKDTVFVPSRGHVVLRVKADNLGVWMLHCHVLWHQVTGMVMGLEVIGEG